LLLVVVAVEAVGAAVTRDMREHIPMAAMVVVAVAVERDLGFTQPLRWDLALPLPWAVQVVAVVAQMYMTVISLVEMAVLVVIRNVFLMEQD
jgi:hypothetical protein